ncbi:NYN domain-containing protein [Modestobacter marinus]|uniref:NYN domain-containing protein n=1 Tax=Modestobacter marinus TaxID=477641 RepID=UPI0027E13866|nr:NYN domain-containing protein [Modestobacter marinus]
MSEDGRVRRRRRATSPAGAPPPAATPDRHTDPVTDSYEVGTVSADGRFDVDRPALDLLVWDAPNIDMTLATVIGTRPTAASRPRFDAIAAWFVDGANDPTAPEPPDVEACVFANVPPQHVASLQRWVEALRSFGYAVFARPKLQPDDDIDQSMLDHISMRAHDNRLRRLVVFSGDGRNFAEPLEDLARAGTEVVVVAFSEVAGYAISSELLEFIDIEDVPGAFAAPLDRVRLDALPADGAWLRPTKSLRDAANLFAARRSA